MNRDFVFEDEGSEPFVLPPKSQSPWEFASYSETVANEHARRNTTSIDHKISQLRSRLYKPHESEENDVDEDEDEEENEVEEGGGRGGKFSRNGPAMAQEDGKDVKAMKTGHWEGENDDADDDDEDEESSDIESLDDTPSVPSKTPAKIHKEDIETKAAETGSHKKGSNDFFASSEGASFSANSFVELNLSRPLLRACESLGYQKPTPIQAACIPLALTGRDICGSAITGSGKTAAFGLPVLERLLFRPKRIPAIRVLILTPTRELAVQVHSMLEKLAQFTDIRCCLVVGGLSATV